MIRCSELKFCRSFVDALQTLPHTAHDVFNQMLTQIAVCLLVLTFCCKLSASMKMRIPAIEFQFVNIFIGILFNYSIGRTEGAPLASAPSSDFEIVFCNQYYYC